jgi:Lon protease-like protein
MSDPSFKQQTVPIFPLPNVVLFPKTMLPLHVFEPRYRQMTQHALATDQLIAVVLLKSDVKEDYHGKPAVFSTGTVGRIVDHELLEDGRYNVLLEGLERVQLIEDDIEDIDIGDEPVLYRRARAIPLPEKLPLPGSQADSVTRIELSSLIAELLVEMEPKNEGLEALSMELPFDELVNKTASLLDLSHEIKQTLLELDELTLRARSIEMLIRERITFWKTLREYRRLAPEDPSVN